MTQQFHPRTKQLIARGLAAAILLGGFAICEDADARPFGKRKAGWSASSHTKAKQLRKSSTRRPLFSSNRSRSSSSARTASRSISRPRVAIGQSTPMPTRVVHHQPEAKPEKKRSLLRRIFGEPVKKKPARSAGATQRVAQTRQLAPGKPNAVQGAPVINHHLLSKGSRGGRRVVVNIAQQRAYLYVDGKVAVSTPVSTARSGKHTPRGTFRVGERVAQGKISTIYHVGMPYWMRLGGSAYGMHAGYLPGYPASAGCIRMPYSAAQAIYGGTSHGTNVTITSG